MATATGKIGPKDRAPCGLAMVVILAAAGHRYNQWDAC